jgi:hypothetical protein
MEEEESQAVAAAAPANLDTIMVDAPQSENLDMDTIMVDAPPLPVPEDPTALPKETEEILAGVNVNPTDLNPALNPRPPSPPSPPDPSNASQGPPARETEYQRLQRRRI